MRRYCEEGSEEDWRDMSVGCTFLLLLLLLFLLLLVLLLLVLLLFLLLLFLLLFLLLLLPLIDDLFFFPSSDHSSACYGWRRLDHTLLSYFLLHLYFSFAAPPCPSLSLPAF